MSRWRAFVDVLDEILNDREAVTAPPVSDVVFRAAGISSTPIFTFTPHRTNRFWASPGPFHTDTAIESDRGQAAEVRRPLKEQPRAGGEQPRPSRTLKPAEETALQTLVRLGGGLDRSFTMSELRTTFRALAQRYHPDRHPNASDTERMRLGATFAELTAAYGVLHDVTGN
ncbi:MAG: DnaJ domain-containing protein [Vicinamibacterales bacterium]